MKVSVRQQARKGKVHLRKGKVWGSGLGPTQPRGDLAVYKASGAQGPLGLVWSLSPAKRGTRSPLKGPSTRLGKAEEELWAGPDDYLAPGQDQAFHGLLVKHLQLLDQVDPGPQAHSLK